MCFYTWWTGAITLVPSSLTPLPHTVTVSSGDTVAGATNVPAPSPPSHIPPPSSPSHVTPPSSPSHLSLQGDVRLRSSSMNHLDKSNTRRVVERDRMLDALNIFSWLLNPQLSHSVNSIPFLAVFTLWSLLSFLAVFTLWSPLSFLAAFIFWSPLSFLATWTLTASILSLNFISSLVTTFTSLFKTPFGTSFQVLHHSHFLSVTSTNEWSSPRCGVLRTVLLFEYSLSCVRVCI